MDEKLFRLLERRANIQGAITGLRRGPVGAYTMPAGPRKPPGLPRSVLPPAHHRRIIRKLSGITQAELCRAMGVTQPRLVLWEQGSTPMKPRRQVYIDVLERLRAAFLAGLRSARAGEDDSDVHDEEHEGDPR